MVSASEVAASKVALPPKISDLVNEIHLAGAVADTKITEIVCSAAESLRANRIPAIYPFCDARKCTIFVFRAIW